MDVQTGLICVGLVVVSAAVILFASMFGMKEKTYEEAIAEQRKLPDDLLLGKREKAKEKKHKNKAGGKKVKEKKEEKEDKEDEKTEHVQFEENPQILIDEVPIQEEKTIKGNKKKGKVDKVKPILLNKDEAVVLVPEPSLSQPQTEDINHFDLTQPKDDLELIRSHSKDNLQQVTQSEPIVNKSLVDTPTKSKKNVKEQSKKGGEAKEEKKDVANAPQQQAVKETPKEIKEQQKETPVKMAKEIVKETVVPVQSSVKESKNKKKKNDILAQIGGDKDGVNISLLMHLIQKAELSRSEIQILTDQLLNKQLDNPLEHSEWTEGRTDPMIKLKKQLAEKEKALADEQEASVAVQNKLKELRSELNAEKSRLSANVRQLEETLSSKTTEAQNLHTRVQHILETHAAEKQGFAKQIEHLQSQVNEKMNIIHQMQEDQGQTQGHLQQELVAQRKQMEVQYSQMRDNENALKAQLTQKHAEMQELQNINMTVNQEIQMLRSTCENSAAEVERHRQQLAMMQDQLIHSEGQLQHYKDAGERLQDMARQLEESHRTIGDLEHRLQNTHRHEQDLQKQLNSIKSELNAVKNEANEANNLKAELNKVQAELNKLKSDLSVSQNEAKTEAVEITSLRTELSTAQNDLKQSQSNLIVAQTELKNSQSNSNKLQKELDIIQADFRKSEGELVKARSEGKNAKAELSKAQSDLNKARTELFKTQEELRIAHKTMSELKMLLVEVERLQQGAKNSFESQIEVARLQEENNRLSSQSGTLGELQKEVRNLVSQLVSNTERPNAEGRENGVETKAVKNNIQHIEHNNLLEQKETLLEKLRVEVNQKDTELNKLTVQLETLQSDVNNERRQRTNLQDELEVQKQKNNELRTKNWKVMEALSAAESRTNSNSGTAIDKLSHQVGIDEQKSTKALLQRIFPDVSIVESSHEKWLTAFEDKVSSLVKDSKLKQEDMEKQNQKLQGMVSQHIQGVEKTEGILNKLQNHVESEEARWQVQIKQKEEILASLKTELDDLRNKSALTEQLEKKISELETRLAEAETFRHQAQTQLVSFKVQSELSPVKGEKNLSLSMAEKLGEENSRLLQSLQQEISSKAAVDAEVARLRSVLEKSESSLAEEKNLVSQLQNEVYRLKNDVSAGFRNSDQSTVNGPPISDSSKSESTVVAHSLLAALEKSLKNTELAKCSITEPATDLVERQQEPDTSFLISKTSSPQTCHMIDHNTQASWNPLNSQQHKKHKKKRKSTMKPVTKRRRFTGWFRKKVTTSRNKLR
ncbi:kinectin-like [Diprion similis]|uniref:kinectin-like n=1 Tax=Diprion similis TaxID=362088 RepID=UPI001EF75971|nr:kinectin-like [Diprion similis]